MKSRSLLAVVLPAAIVGCHSDKQDSPPSASTLSQTSPIKTSSLVGWTLATSGPGIPLGQSPTGYSFGRDTAVSHRGHASARIVGSGVSDTDWRALSQGIAADEYLNKRLQLRGFIKTTKVSGFAGLWIRVDGKAAVLAEACEGEKKIGTTTWTVYSAIVDVPATATDIYFGPMIAGSGEVWVDDLSLTIVGASTPVSHNKWGTQMPAKSTSTWDLLKMAKKPVNLNFES